MSTATAKQRTEKKRTTVKEVKTTVANAVIPVVPATTKRLQKRAEDVTAGVQSFLYTIVAVCIYVYIFFICSSDDEVKTKTKAQSKATRKRARPDLGVLGDGLKAVLQASKDSSRDIRKKQRLDKALNEQDDSTTSATVEADRKKGSSDPPDNFSRVNTDLPDAVLQEKFPAFAALKQRGAVVDVVLKAGQMLYIPAGWFHEVRSRSCDNGRI